jgi:tryptophan halogenase
MNNNKKFVVVGGGTAGWLTALFIRQKFPTSSVTLVRSDDIGIIGVGEATTPNLVALLHSLELDLTSLLIETNGSIKNAIQFKNWNGDDKSYYHSFSENLSGFSIPNVFSTDCFDYYIKHLIQDDLSFEEYTYTAKLSSENKIDLSGTHWALHFDAKLMANYLEEIGLGRNIDVIVGTINAVNQDSLGNVSSLLMNDENSIDVDFIFDCSGFNKLIIGKLYNQKWISYDKYLPAKKAIAFWLEPEKDIRPYTSAIAMKYGWCWNIPLSGGRTSAGYVFDTDYITPSEALHEMELYYGKKLEVRKEININAGRYENVWVKNCIALGLAGSFIEPLESTSIFLTVGQLSLISHFLNDIEKHDETSIKLFNEVISNNMENTLAFVWLHYLTKRTDTEFWKNFATNYDMPEKLKPILPLIKSNNLRYLNTVDIKTTASFPMYSYLQVGHGLGLIENSKNLSGYENIVPSPIEYKNIIESKINTAANHTEFIKQLHKIT